MSELNAAQAAKLANIVNSILPFSGEHQGGAALTNNYLANGGAFAGATVLGMQGYPMPACTLKNLRAVCNANTLAAPMTVEVYVDGAIASGLKVVIPAGSTALFADLVDTVVLPAGHRIDLRCDSTAGGVGNSATVVATVEVSV